MNDPYLILALDDSTRFLNIFFENFPDLCFTIEAHQDSIDSSLLFLNEIPDGSIVLFLGHGHSSGLYTPTGPSFGRQIFIDSKNAGNLFKNKHLILLCCNSNQFIDKFSGYYSVIGFGNIISSMNEIGIEAETTGYFRPIDIDDIEVFNSSYCRVIIEALRFHSRGLIEIKDLSLWIEFLLNKTIGELLLNKNISKRKQIARLLFDFRNEMSRKSISF